MSSALTDNSLDRIIARPPAVRPRRPTRRVRRNGSDETSAATSVRGLRLTVGVAAASEAPTAKPGFDGVRPIVEKYCVRCHSGAKPRGGLNLDAFKDQAAVLAKPKVWEKVSEYLRGGMMPPEGKPKPTPAELDAFYAWLDADVLKVDCTTGPKDPGRVTIRRLNRAEYNNTIRDLVGVDFQPGRRLPLRRRRLRLRQHRRRAVAAAAAHGKVPRRRREDHRRRLEVRRGPQAHPHRSCRKAQGKTATAPAESSRPSPNAPIAGRSATTRSGACSVSSMLAEKNGDAVRDGHPARPAGGARVAALPLPRRDRPRRRATPASRRQRLRAGHPAVVLPLEQHARRGAVQPRPRGRPASAGSARSPGPADAQGPQGARPWSRTSPASGCRSATSRASRPTPTSSRPSTTSCGRRC